MKKTALFLAAALLLTLFTLPAGAFSPGDVDGSGTLEAADARLALRAAVGLEEYEYGSEAFTAADADGSGVIEASDARLILRAAVGLEELQAFIKEQNALFSVSLPAAWDGKYECEATDTSLSFYHKAVRAATGNGLLFTLRLVLPAESCKDIDEYAFCRVFVDGTEYYAESIITGDAECPEALDQEYFNMLDTISDILPSLTAAAENVRVEPFDFSALFNTYTGTSASGRVYTLLFFENIGSSLNGELYKDEPDGDTEARFCYFTMRGNEGEALLAEGGSIRIRTEENGLYMTVTEMGGDDWATNGEIALKPEAFPTEPPAEKLSSSEVYRTAAAFTYEIKAENTDFISTGTGFAINREGWIVTNYHVIENADFITVQNLAGLYYPVQQVIAFDRDLDLAILKISHARAWALLNKKTYATGDKIYTLGSSKELTGTFSDGVISRKSSEIDNLPVQFIQISAPISPGNSGGPLLNEYGEVIGVNSRTYNEGQNLNFAIPLRYLDELDTTNPLTMEEFSALEREYQGSGDPLYGENAILIPYDDSEVIPLMPGATAFIPVFASYDEENFTLNCDVGGAGVFSSWSQWITSNQIYLFLTLTEEARNVPVTVSVTGHPEISYTITVTASEGGGEEIYFSPPATDVPDAGAIWNVSSSGCEISDDASLKRVDYAGWELLETGKTVASLRMEYEARLSAHGFTFITEDINEADTEHIYRYRNNETDVAVNYYEYFDPETGGLLTVSVEFYDPMLDNAMG